MNLFLEILDSRLSPHGFLNFKSAISLSTTLRVATWVASIVFEEHPTMNVEEIKSAFRKKGLGEYSLYGLGITNEKTVGECVAELEEMLRWKNWRKSCLCELEVFRRILERGIIRLSDGLLDAVRKIEHAA